ncbi:MAG: glutathione S-transferase family protein [Deltaproteobacteria bacterium]|nr:glutathione S-transferase family protein [Deltaproteobacteria bacterium]
MALTLYFAPDSSSSPITWALAELGLEYEAVELDLRNPDAWKSNLLPLNPMAQVPTLIDDGQPLFESSAILVHLGDRYGVERGLWPAIDSPDRMVALSWTMWFAVTVGSAMKMVMLNTGTWWPAQMQNELQAAKGRERLTSLLTILDERLATQPYIVGSTFSLVDALGAPTLRWASHGIGFDLAATPHVSAWVERCIARDTVEQMK